MTEGVYYDIENRTCFSKQIRGRAFKFVIELCEKCKKERHVRIDKWLNRKTNLCGKCNGLRNLPKPKLIHGFSKCALYKKYKGMIYRCYNEKNNNFKYYGGRGIGVSMDWLNTETGLQSFIAWSIQNGFKPGLQIDRIDNDGDYCPENCRFITGEENRARQKDLFGIPGLVSKNHIDDHPKKKKEKTIESCLSDNESSGSEKLVSLSDWLSSI